MIRKKLSKLPDSAAMGRTMNYALKKAALVGGSQVKFDGTSIEDFVKLGIKKCDQVNNKYGNKTGRTQENQGMHEMISFDAGDKISTEKAAELALSVWRDVLDIDNHEHRWGVHTDTDQIHVHMVWNKRDNTGKIYNQKNDYELFEKALHKIEVENGLKVVQNRKFLNPGMPTNPQPSNEYRYEKKGKKSDKTLFKEAVTAATDKAITAGEFLEFLHADGYTLITNSNLAYSLEKDGQIFKASDVGASYKALKARFGDDPQFSDTLARLGTNTAPKRQMGSIGGDFHDEQAAITDRRIKNNRVLDLRFETDDNRSFRFKGSNREAFTVSNGAAHFNTNSPVAIKAGLQKLTEKGKPETLYLSGTEDFKRQAWMQFYLMGLDQKGYGLKGYQPSVLDTLSLENMKASNGIDKKGSDPLRDMKDEKGDLDETNSNKDPKAKKREKEADRLMRALADIFTDHGGPMRERMSQNRVLEAQIKNKSKASEDEHHSQVRHQKNKLKPRPQ